MQRTFRKTFQRRTRRTPEVGGWRGAPLGWWQRRQGGGRWRLRAAAGGRGCADQQHSENLIDLATAVTVCAGAHGSHCSLPQQRPWSGCSGCRALVHSGAASLAAMVAVVARSRPASLTVAGKARSRPASLTVAGMARSRAAGLTQVALVAQAGWRTKRIVRGMYSLATTSWERIWALARLAVPAAAATCASAQSPARARPARAGRWRRTGWCVEAAEAR